MAKPLVSPCRTPTFLILVAAASLLSACATPAAQTPARSPEAIPAKPLPTWMDPKADANPFPSTYRPAASGEVAIVHATILTAAGPRIDDGTILIADNRIVAVGRDIAIPAGARIIDASGRWVTPGLIDGHSHAAAVSIPFATLADGLNESTDPNTAQLFVEGSLWAQSPDIPRAREAGVTTLHVMPGSGNEFGGRTVVLKSVPATTVQQMKFPDAPYGVKMACGENPTRVYGPKGRTPMTRASVVAGMRAAFFNGADYAKKWDDYRAKAARGEKAEPPRRDFQLDTVAGIVKGDVRVQMHCYRADDMAFVLDLAHEFGFKVTAFHHATEAFKIIPLLKENGVCVFTWGPDWGGFKMEAYDHTAIAPGMIERAGGCVAITSDSGETMQHLNQDAARSMAAANRAGLEVTPEEAIRWVTLNPARGLGIDRQTGSLEPGKSADVVIWSRNPFSVYARAEQVLIDGNEVYRRGDLRYRRPSDLELDQVGERHER